jgi:uncharacterized glyoxalase superfamily protein PhnB
MTSLFTSLADGGAIIMSLQKTFWTEEFGRLRNRSSVAWLVNVTHYVIPLVVVH